MSLIQDGGEEVEEDAVYHVTLKRVQIQQAASKGARWLGIERDQLPPDHTVSQHETCKIRSIKAGTLEKLVENLLTAFGDNDFNYINIFLSTYRGFASTKEVLELILDRYGNLDISNCEEDRSQNSTENKTVLRTAIASILRAWLEQCSEDFREPPDYFCLQKLLAYLARVMPGSVLEGRAQNLLEQFRKQKVMNGEIHNILANEEKLETGSSEGFSSFSEDFVAEQLTYVDAELFKRVVPYHCLGSIWSQRSKKENNHLALTIRATIAQFNAVTQCVIRTILNDKELKTLQRAKIIEKWIDIAHDLEEFFLIEGHCFSATIQLHLSVKKCWSSVSKDSMLMFEELSEIFSDRDNYLISRELLMREGTSKFANLESSVKENQKRTQRRLQLQKDMGIMQGTVPYLGTFLTDLTMLDAALQNYVEGGLINFEKRRREFEVIAQIKLLQSSCNSYCMTSDRRFIQWFRKQPALTEEESYTLACEIEAALDTTATSPNSRKSMVKRLSLLFQGSDVISNTMPTKEQPSGSSGESMAFDSVSPCESPDGPQKNLSESSSPSSSNHSMDTSSSGVSSFALSPPPSLDSNPGVHPLSISSTSAPWPPYYNQKNQESCIIRVHLEPSNGNMYKSILVTNQDKAPAVMQRALLKHNLDPIAVEEYDLVQVISQKKELLIPFDANVFYAINSQADFDFVMRRKFDMFKMTLPKKRGWWRRRR